MHLILCRIIPLVVFAVFLLTSSNFPVQFPCPWPNEPTAMSTAKANLTQSPTSKHSVVDCTYPMGNRNEKIAVTVATVNFLSAAFAFVELSYLLYSAWKDDNLLTDLEFCCVYILRKRKRIRKIIRKIKENMSSDIFYLHDDFGEKQLSHRRLEEMYVNVMVREGRESTPNSARELEGSRHRVYGAHLEARKDSTTLTEMADLFKPIGVCKTYPRTILVVGRPGIGKTVLTKRIMSQWQQQELGFWHDKIVILVRFFSFNKVKRRSNLLEMLCCSAGFYNMSSTDFNAISEYIFLMPSKVVLILDGLDELVVDESFPEERIVNCHNEVTHVRLIFEQLVKGELLPGVTVLTTSRPTAEEIYKNVKFDREVEILGFKKDQIKDYVDKFFCGNMERGCEIWNLIESSPEYLSLCYVPVNSYIVCLTLNESIEAGGKDNAPRTITELYKRAIKILLYRHHLRYKGKSIPKDYLIAKLPEDLQNDLNKLKEIARDGMMTDQLVFEFQSDDAFFAKLDNCGLFNKLEDKQQNIFCFLHLTIQEFLAAQHVVDDISNVKDFIGNHCDDTKLFLVIQFVAGLIGDKMRELKKERNSLERLISAEEAKIESKRERLSKLEADIESICKRLSAVEAQIESISKRFKDMMPVMPVIRRNHLFVIKLAYEMQEKHVMELIASSFECTDDDPVQVITLAGLNIAPVDTTALFRCISYVKELRQLSITNCSMQEHSTFGELAKLLDTEYCQLIKLDLSGNMLTNVAAECLKDSLTSVNCKLTALDLSFNKLTGEGAKHLSVALTSGNCKLTGLDVSSNELTDDGVKHLSDALTSAYCKLTDEGIGHLSDALKTANCKLIRLSVNCQVSTEKGARLLGDALKSGDCKLTELYVSSSRLTDEGAKHLCNALKNCNCKLIILDVSSNILTDKGAEHLSTALKNGDCKLTVLDVSANRLTDKGAELLSVALKSGNVKLTSLNLSSNKLADEGAEHLSDALKSRDCKLTSLDVSSNKLTTVGAKHLSDALMSGDCNLTELHVSSNEFTDGGAEHLSNALKSGKCNLAKLHANYNKITAKGAEHLSNALKSGKCKLTELDVNSNKLKDEGAKQLSNVLKDANCKLAKLDVSYNKLTDEGAEHLSTALKNGDCKLTVLDVSANRLTDEGAKHLSAALMSGDCKLIVLSINRNKLTDEGAKHLSEALKSDNCKLTSLDLHYNELTGKVAEDLNGALKSSNCRQTVLRL